MSPRIVIAALAITMIGALAAVPSLAQTPEKSAAAMAAPQAKSESAEPSSAALPDTSTARTFSAERSASDPAGEKAKLVTPTAK